MSTEPNIHDDRALDISPPIQARQPPEVTTGPFRIRVTFFDGVAGIVDMTERVHSPCAGIFGVLADPAVFAQAFVLYGTVAWPGKLDLAPDTMYDAFTTKGEWVLR